MALDGSLFLPGSRRGVQTVLPLATDVGGGVRRLLFQVNGQPVTAQIGGVLRGLMHDGLAVSPGMKVGDVDPRAEREHCFTISDKSLAVGGGVLEALMMLLQR